MASFGKRLRALRQKKGLTQSELGKILNVTNVGVAKWESDDRFPDKDMLIKIADFFDVSLDYLLGRTDDPNTVILTNKKHDLPENLKGLGLDENIPTPKEYEGVDIEIEADRKTMPDVITEEMVREILEFLKKQGYEIKPKQANESANKKE